MKRKITAIIISLLMLISTIVFVNNDQNVKATWEGGEENNIGLDFDFMWDVSYNVSQAVYLAWEGDEITKGREFGTKGDNWTADKIQTYMEADCGLENVDKIPLGPIGSCDDRYYTSKININDYLLHVDNTDYHGDTGLPSDVPKNETFVFPQAYPQNSTGNLTFNSTMLDGENVRVIEPWSEDLAVGGSLTNYYLNLSVSAANQYDLIMGNATYITDDDPLPQDQDGRVLIFDEEEGECEERLENVTNATGVILIHDVYLDYNTPNASNCSFSVGRVDSNDSNLSYILDMLNSSEIMLVENVLCNETLTFTYNIICDFINWPSYNFILIDMFEKPMPEDSIPYNYWLCPLTVILRAVNLLNLPCKGECKGVIMFNNFTYGSTYNGTHFMNNNNPDRAHGGWFRLIYPFGDAPFGFPGLPVYFVNYTVGNWLLENASNINNTVTGYINQTYLKEMHGENPQAGVEAYNVIGNITTDRSGNVPDPVDPIILVSNRFDGWWSEASFDSGCGVGVVLAIAKYFKDFNITPKVNITFLETTGEEFGYRGAQHFSDSHPDNNYCLWIGFDQLAVNWENTTLNLTYNDYEIRDICCAVADETDYNNRTLGKNYTINHDPPSGDSIGAEEDVWKDRDKWKIFGGIDCEYPCKTICFCKDAMKTNPFRHRRGENFSEGDLLKNIDREDLNVTLELAWNITKYFCVNPDCWITNYTASAYDSPEDSGDQYDSIRVNFTMNTILPQDSVMVNATLTPSDDFDDIVNQTFVNYTINTTGKQASISLTLPPDGTPGLYKLHLELYNSTGRINEIVGIEENNVNDTEPVPPQTLNIYPYVPDTVPPNITNVSANPDMVGFGFNVTISANIVDSGSGLSSVKINITQPDSTYGNYSMSLVSRNTYQYIFNDTWLHGQYNYTIWAIDNASNNNTTSVYSFNVSANATISVCTIKDSYGGNETINLTDPPVDPSLIGYELLDYDKVLRIWNKFDSYYFNTTSGIQLTNHYNEYWSHNVLMLGYYNNDQWNLIYRTDELSGFNKDIDTDNETYVNATLWKDLTYKGYNFRLAIRYHLGVDDKELTVIPYIKNLGQAIQYNLGFAWELKDIQVDMTPSGDYIEINGTIYYLNQSLDETYKNMDLSCFYIREDISSDRSESLYLCWNDSLDYLVKVKSRTGQYNAPVILGIKIGTLSVGQEKYTSLFWHDASEITYYFNSYNTGETWAANPGYMVDGSTSTYASTTVAGDVELCNGNNCSGSDLGDIVKVELRVFGYYASNQRDIVLTPVFGGTTHGGHYTYGTSTTPSWSRWFDITTDPFFTPPWSWTKVDNLDCDVEAKSGFGFFTLYCSKVEIRVTYIPNINPTISNPYPADGSTGISIVPVLNITVVDSDGDSMNITWLCNSSGSWQVFGTNNSVVNGTYHQTLANASVNGEWWYWKVNVTDGINNTESSVYKFYTGYQSKINNTGSTNIKGYLLIQVQYYNESSQSWFVVDDTVNETVPRTILWADPGGTPGQNILALDTVFNGLVNTDDLNHGNGLYRVYAAFRDPDGDVLVCDDDSLLEATYEFTVTLE